MLSNLDYRAIDPYKPLRPELAIENAAVQLYLRGIIVKKFGNASRSFFYNPYFIIFIELVYFTRSLASLFVPESNRRYFVYAGDYMYFVNAKTHINIAATQYMLLGINWLCISWFRHWRGIEPKFLRSLAFLWGEGTPAKAGLLNRKYILELTTKSRYVVRFNNFNTRLVFVVSFAMSIVPIAFRVQWNETLLYGLPWSIIFAISSYHTFSSYYLNLTYFYILCHYFKLRLREMSDHAYKIKIRKDTRWLTPRHFLILKNKYQRIEQEIRGHDATYWSNFIFYTVFLLSTFNNVLLYAALFVPMDFVVQISLFYASFLSNNAIFFLLNKASLVFNQSRKCRVGFYSLYASMQRFLCFRSLFKLQSIIESMNKAIGFHFANLFIINYSRFAETICIIIAYFLKITDLSFKNKL